MDLAVINISGEVSKDFREQFVYKNGGAAIDVTGYTFTGTIKDSDGDTVQSLSTQGDNTTTGFYIGDATTGILTFNVRSAEMTSIGAGDYTYEICVADTDSTTEIFATGGFTIWTNGNH